MVHIILLTQSSAHPNARRWLEFTSIHDCCKHVCEMFEVVLKKRFPFMTEIVYDITDLYAFVDELEDLSCLVCRMGNNVYVGYSKEWIKMKLFFTLRKEVDMAEIES